MKPTEFGKYTLVERVSHGGMAEVFRAKTFGAAGFERTVAIKLLLPNIAEDDSFVTMLIDEAKIAGQLSHSNIAQIFDLGFCDSRYYIVQEFVDGKDVRAVLNFVRKQNKPLTVPQVCHLMSKICEGLDYAHNKTDLSGNPLNLVHRDISPQNILVSFEGEVKLVDFGIAKAEGRATQTVAGLVKGKFAYMSPEQLRGLPVDRRSDVYACGIVMHELLTGQPLFKRNSEMETLRRARSATVEPPSSVNRNVPPELDRIVLKALSRHVDDRFQSAVAMRDAISEVIARYALFYSRSDLQQWMTESFQPDAAATASSSASIPQAEPVKEISASQSAERPTVPVPKQNVDLLSTSLEKRVIKRETTPPAPDDSENPQRQYSLKSPPAGVPFIRQVATVILENPEDAGALPRTRELDYVDPRTYAEKPTAQAKSTSQPGLNFPEPSATDSFGKMTTIGLPSHDAQPQNGSNDRPSLSYSQEHPPFAADSPNKPREVQPSDTYRDPAYSQQVANQHLAHRSAPEAQPLPAFSSQETMILARPPEPNSGEIPTPTFSESDVKEKPAPSPPQQSTGAVSAKPRQGNGFSWTMVGLILFAMAAGGIVFWYYYLSARQ